jgi:hypothetical protein
LAVDRLLVDRLIEDTIIDKEGDEVDEGVAMADKGASPM